MLLLSMIVFDGCFVMFLLLYMSEFDVVWCVVVCVFCCVVLVCTVFLGCCVCLFVFVMSCVTCVCDMIMSLSLLYYLFFPVFGCANVVVGVWCFICVCVFGYGCVIVC